MAVECLHDGSIFRAVNGDSAVSFANQCRVDSEAMTLEIQDGQGRAYRYRRGLATDAAQITILRYPHSGEFIPELIRGCNLRLRQDQDGLPKAVVVAIAEIGNPTGVARGYCFEHFVYELVE